VLAAGILGMLLVSSTAAAAQQCRNQVIADWSDNGRVDRVYPLPCYEEAIDAMPPEVRDYSDAQDSIERALTTAVRRKTGNGPQPARKHSFQAVAEVDTSGAARVPAPLLLLGALGLGIAATGAFGYLGRRATLGRKDAPR
jgi:hypothetical protein